jgi:hypothetical protein
LDGELRDLPALQVKIVIKIDGAAGKVPGNVAG